MKKERLRQRVLKDSFWNISSNFLGKVGALIFTIILARFLLPEGFGIYSLAISIALIFMTFADLGVNQTMLRYVSSEIKENKKKAAAYFNYLLRIKIILSLSLSLFLILIAYPLALFVFNKPVLFLPLFFLGIYVFLFTITDFFILLFYISKKVKYVLIKETIFQLVRILAVVIIFYILISQYYILGVVFGLIFTSFITLIFILFYFKKNFLFLIKKTKKQINKKRVLKFLGFLTIGSVSAAFFSYIDIIMLGIFLPSKYIGYYRSSFALVFGIAGMLTFTNVFLPVLTQIPKNKLENVFNNILKYSLILIVPSSFGLAVLSKYFIILIYGKEYIPATILLFFLSFLIIPTVLVGIFMTFFTAREKLKSFAIFTVIITFLNIFLNYIFIYYFLNISDLWATTGAAIATLISWYFYLFGSFLISRNILNVKLNIINFIKPLIASIIMAGVLIYSNNFYSEINFKVMILKVIFGAIIYILTLFLIKGISIREIKELSKIINKK